MSRVIVEFSTDNASFRPHGDDLDVYEVASVLALAGAAVEGLAAGGVASLRDVNGNPVGTVTVEEDT